MKRPKKFLITLIIPAYRQERTISKDLRRIHSVMKQLRYDFEIIVVIDGKVDKTFENAKKIKSPKLHILGYDINQGKGYAIKVGMAKAKGDIVAFIDSGMDLDPNGLSMLLEHFEWYKADIIVGSKRHPVSKVQYPLVRRVISYCSQLFIRFLFGLNVRDTQVGMKFFRKKVVDDVFPRLLVKKFAFDIEMLAVAYYLGYKRIYEAPIELKYNFKNSAVSQQLFQSLYNTLWDTLAIFYRLKILRYYDNINKKRWRYKTKITYKLMTS